MNMEDAREMFEDLNAGEFFLFDYGEGNCGRGRRLNITIDTVKLGNGWLFSLEFFKALIDTINKFKNTNYTLEEVVAKYNEVDLKSEFPGVRFSEPTKEATFNELRELLAVFEINTFSAHNYWYERYKYHNPKW